MGPGQCCEVNVDNVDDQHEDGEFETPKRQDLEHWIQN